MESEITSTPPSISEDVRKRLLEELNLDVDPQTRSIIEGITRESQSTTAERLADLARTVFQDIADVKPEFVRMVVESQQSRQIWQKDSFAAGMAIVARAFDLATNHRLIERMAVLDEEDLASVNETVSKMYEATLGKSIMEQVLEAPRIPEHEINLRYCIGKAVDAQGYFKDDIRRGAVAMYRIFAQLWPKLFPPQGQSQG